jgi:hypothetical protein
MMLSLENWTVVIDKEIGYDYILTMRRQRLHHFLNNASDLKKMLKKGSFCL